MLYIRITTPSGKASNGGKLSGKRSQSSACYGGPREGNGPYPSLCRHNGHKELLSASGTAPSPVPTDPITHPMFKTHPFGRSECSGRDIGAPEGKAGSSIHGTQRNAKRSIPMRGKKIHRTGRAGPTAPLPTA